MDKTENNIEILDHTEDNIKILDGIDFTKYINNIKKGYNVRKFFDAIENDLNNTEITNNDILEGYIFNWLSEMELIEYFEKRYPESFKVVEHIQYIFC